MKPTTLLYDFHVHDVVRVEYRVAAGAPLAPDCAPITRETRAAGGNGVVMACALAKWGAQVLLTGNPLGDDAHGRFLLTELQVPNLRFEPTLQAGFSTPYAILLRTEMATVEIRTLETATVETMTFLSPSASNLQLEPVAPHQARHFVSAPGALDGASQSYAALVESLRRAANLGREWAGLSDDFASVVTQAYKDSFAGPLSILSREETEAMGRAER